MNTPFDRITIDTEMINGLPCTRGMRLTERRVIRLLWMPRSTVRAR